MDLRRPTDNDVVSSFGDEDEVLSTCGDVSQYLPNSPTPSVVETRKRRRGDDEDEGEEATAVVPNKRPTHVGVDASDPVDRSPANAGVGADADGAANPRKRPREDAPSSVRSDTPPRKRHAAGGTSTDGVGDPNESVDDDDEDEDGGASRRRRNQRVNGSGKRSAAHSRMRLARSEEDDDERGNDDADDDDDADEGSDSVGATARPRKSGKGRSVRELCLAHLQTVSARAVLAGKQNFDEHTEEMLASQLLNRQPRREEVVPARRQRNAQQQQQQHARMAVDDESVALELTECDTEDMSSPWEQGYDPAYDSPELCCFKTISAHLAEKVDMSIYPAPEDLEEGSGERDNWEQHLRVLQRFFIPKNPTTYNTLQAMLPYLYPCIQPDEGYRMNAEEELALCHERYTNRIARVHHFLVSALMAPTSEIEIRASPDMARIAKIFDEIAETEFSLYRMAYNAVSAMRAISDCNPKHVTAYPDYENLWTPPKIDDGYALIEEFFLNKALAQDWRFVGEAVYKPKIVRDPETGKYYKSNSWELYNDSMTKVLYNLINTSGNEELVRARRASKGSNVRAVCASLAEMDHPKFPPLKRNRHFFSTNKGVYYTVKNEFYPFNEGPYVFGKDQASANFLEGEIKEEWLTMPVMDIPTPTFDMVFKAQDFTDEERFWIYGLFGRILYAIHEHPKDALQIIPYMLGQGGNGKSTVVEHVMGLFDPSDIGIMSNVIEKEFGLESLADKFAFYGCEIKRGFQLDQGVFHSIVAGESVAIMKKFKKAHYQLWRSPGILGGNQMPGFVDLGGSIFRRLVVIHFRKRIPSKQVIANLKDKLKAERCATLVKINRCYQEMLERINFSDIWSKLPKKFLDAREEANANMAPILTFLRSWTRRTSDDMYVSRIDLETAWSLYRRQHLQNADRSTLQFDTNAIYDAAKQLGAEYKRASKLYPPGAAEAVSTRDYFLIGRKLISNEATRMMPIVRAGEAYDNILELEEEEEQRQEVAMIDVPPIDPATLAAVPTIAANAVVPNTLPLSVML